MMRVLVACEYSGTVRDAFIKAGHDALSCDLLPTELPGPHYQGDVRDILADGWDLMIAHPPCTHLAVSGARWFKDKQVEQAEALEFVRMLLDAPIHASRSKTRSASFPAVSESQIRLSSRMSMAMKQPKQRACGLKAYRILCRPRLWARARGTSLRAVKVCPSGITCRRHPIAGKSGLLRFPALRLQWPANGARWRKKTRHKGRANRRAAGEKPRHNPSTTASRAARINPMRANMHPPAGLAQWIAPLLIQYL
jgi:hypothetical protein